MSSVVGEGSAGGDGSGDVVVPEVSTSGSISSVAEVAVVVGVETETDGETVLVAVFYIGEDPVSNGTGGAGGCG